MLMRTGTSKLTVGYAFAAFFLIASCCTGRVYAYAPEDPEVREMVDRGVKFLEGQAEASLSLTPYGGGDGQIILAALAHYKAEHNDEAPLVKLGLKFALNFANVTKKNGKLLREAKTHYEVAIAIMFLAELDAVGYRDELQTLGLAMLDAQMTHGGFGYPGDANGDVSQVQYVVLAMWTLDRAGIEFPLDKFGRTLGWLMRVQDIAGPWPYHGLDPGPGKPLIKQEPKEMSLSTSLAGGSSVLIAGDIFRLFGQNAMGGNDVEGLPKALKAIEKEDLIAVRRKKAPVQRDAILAATSRMDAFRAANPFVPSSQADWYYYMIYTMERYESFMELALGRTSEGKWYDQHVQILMSQQDASGGWGIKNRSLTGPPVSTSFAILFLVRSTKKSIGKPATGSLAGGYGLPADTTKIVVNGTQIKGEPTTTAVTDLLDLLEGDGAAEMDDAAIPEGMKLETDPERRRQQLARLERVVRGSKSWQARRVAARLLGSSDDLSVVPALIYALSDPDGPVRTYAKDGLQFISRRFNDFDLPAKPEPEEIRRLQQTWIEWYQNIYPNYVFIGEQ